MAKAKHADDLEPGTITVGDEYETEQAKLMHATDANEAPDDEARQAEVERVARQQHPEDYPEEGDEFVLDTPSE